jgi:hypothetical protein
LLGRTDSANWLQVLDLDPAQAARAQQNYPCYVRECEGEFSKL